MGNRKKKSGKSGNNETFVIHMSVAQDKKWEGSKKKWGRRKEGEGGGKKRMGERKEGKKERDIGKEKS